MPEVTHLQDKDTLVEVAQYPDYAYWPFEKFNPPQSCVIDVFEQDANIGIAAATSAGKAQPDDSLILTPTGYTALKNISVGNFVVGADGSATIVNGVFPQGKKPVYKIRFDDDTETLCCNEHLWAVRTRSQKKRGKDYSVLSTEEIINSFEPKKFHVPIVEPVKFCGSSDPLSQEGLHPYLLGILLGDGGIKYGTKVSNEDENILQKIDKLLPDNCRLIHESKVDYRISATSVPYNPVARELDLMGLLGKCASDKFIPYSYLFSSIDCRRELLRGLMDSDGGGYSNRSPTFEITSRELAEGMAHLIRSFGGWTRIREKSESKYTYKGEIRCGKPVYRMTVILPFNPFGVSKKASLWSARKRDKLRSIVSIESAGEKLCRCIKVRNSDGLYLTNDCIVTHNTVCAEMYIAHENRVRGGKAMYLGTHKALVQEKLNDWTDFDHHFSDLNISICSGDYQLTDARKKELAAADIICMTSEMLASRCRNFKSEKNNFLLDLGTLVVDESHLLTVPGRGDHLEVALMKITEINPDLRIVLLSATMPNVVEICEWISFNLNNKDTYYLNSQYRPVPLDVHYPMYYDQGRYDTVERNKVASALDVIGDHPDDKFLIFAHTKRTGEIMKRELSRIGVPTDFHNANLTKAKRTKIEGDFCNPKRNLRCLIATSTLAWGMNLPARRVIVLGVHRGLSEVDTYDVMQMVGRAGRPKYDKKGDAYILLPQTDVRKQKGRITNPTPITSQLLEHHKILAFHLVSEIHQRTVKTLPDIHEWYSRSLASYQSHDLDYKVDDTLEALMKCGAVVKSDEGVYDVTSVGKIASMFYYSPFDVADLKRNFKGLFDRDKQDDDYWLSMALGNTDTNRTNIVTRADKAAMEEYYRKIEGMSRTRPKPFMEAAIKGGFAYHCLLTGNIPPALYSFAFGLKADFDRLIQVLNVIDSFTGQWEMKEWFETLSRRVVYGVKPELMPLVEIAEIGKVRAEILYEKNIRSAQDILDDPQFARAVLNVKPAIFDKIAESAQALAWKGML